MKSILQLLIPTLFMIILMLGISSRLFWIVMPRSLTELNFSKPIFLKADRHRLVRVIDNLLSNAVKFTKEGTIVTTVKEEDQQRKLIVSVKDSGDGIDRDILPKLFSKFATKSYHGTGLGLYICKAIIEAHGGKIWGENNAGGKGATFTFSLPSE